MESTLKTRLHLLDGLRGLALVNMVAYHVLYDVVYIFGRRIGWYAGTPGYVWQQSICWCFILLSGFCFSLGSRPVRRGLTVLAGGLAVSAVTAVFMPGEQVRFGILTFIGCAMLLTRLCLPVLQKLQPLAGFAAAFAMFWLTKAVPRGGLGLGDRMLSPLPEWMYSLRWLYPLGLPDAGFWSSDYFPLVPWIFLFWCGFFLFRLWPGVRASRLLQVRVPLLGWLGRNSLAVYLLHQPLAYGALLVLHRLGAL